MKVHISSIIMPSQSQSNLQRKRFRWTRWRYMFWDSVTRLPKTVWGFIWRNSVKKKWPRCTWGATTTQWLSLIPNRVIIRFFSLFSQRLGRRLWYLGEKNIIRISWSYTNLEETFFRFEIYCFCFLLHLVGLSWSCS